MPSRTTTELGTPRTLTSRRLLEACLTDDCELIEPRGRFSGRDAIFDRINGFAARFSGARVEITTNVGEHNAVARYGWRIVDGEGKQLLDGIDVVDRTPTTGSGRS